jgi:DNA replication protein DnaC
VHPLGVDGEPVYSQVVSCQCQVQARMVFLNGGGMAAERGIRPEPQTFANFELSRDNRESFNAAKEWAEGKSFLWLLIYGGHGCGKSHLCNAAARRLSERQALCYYRKPSDIHAEVRRAIQANEGKDSVLDQYKQVGCLILDDYGIESGTPEQEANMDDILVSRFEWQLATMMTSNLMWSQFPGRLASRFDDRVLSRRIQNAAPDYRRKK